MTACNGITYATMKVDLKFKATVSDLELMDFRHFLKKRNRGRQDNVVTIQDCKIVAIFLCIQQLPTPFHKIFNLATINKLLRACIVYIQFYLQTYETIVKSQNYLSCNSNAPGKPSPYQAMKEDLDDLRVVIGRFYAAVIFSNSYGQKLSVTDQIIMFECSLKVTTMVVWIALERRYLTIIKMELERIFRSSYYNNIEKTVLVGSNLTIKPENQTVLDGKISDIDKKKTKAPNKLNCNSPIIHNFIRMDEPKLVMIDRSHFESLRDDRLKFLIKYIFVPETEIQNEGVTIGILGLQRRLFDPLLYPCSKRILKLLITSSPMDVSLDRKQLRENAIKIAHRESEPQPPHLFDELPKIPRRNHFTEVAQVKEEIQEETIDEKDEVVEEEEKTEEVEFSEDSREDNASDDG
ncbi:hypothetical protein RUM44_000895 [Polyplax serrata]|uniref:Uncharacterized protein n=1 Tax=Polyplax serrata TaxID=468196 RepID=A0ABR1B8X3_POLSC